MTVNSMEAEAKKMLPLVIAERDRLAAELITARAKLEAAERLAAAAERLRQLHQKSLRTADYHNASCQCPRCIDDEIVAALTAWDAAA